MTTKKQLEEQRDCAENEAASAEADLDEMIAMLKMHGDHTRQCAKIHGQRYYMEPVECDCGWDDIVKEYL